MLLSAVLMLICYKTYDIIKDEIFSISIKANNNIEEITLRKLIADDIRKSNKILSTSSGFICVDTISEIEYIIQDSFLVRGNIRLDTFKFRRLESTFWDDTNQVLMPGYIVNKIELVLEKKGKMLRIVQEKNTASEAYMNQ